MSNSVYQINKGINKPIKFKGLKAQHIWYLGGGLVALLILFAIIYIIGVNVFICLGIIVSLSTVLFMYDIKKTIIRVNHPCRRPLSEHIRREEIGLLPTEDVTGPTEVGEKITEILEYKQGELYVKKYIRPEYIKPTEDATQAKRVIAAAHR